MIGALETVLAGACWPLSRVQKAYPDTNPVCVRCGLEREDAFHTFWGCNCNDDIDDTRVQDSQYLLDRAQRGCIENPSLWLRGLAPADFLTVSRSDIPLVLALHVEGSPPECWPSGTYYGDGSGGDFSDYPELRRCGVGVATLQNGAQWFGVHSRLPGPIQTVPRAENCALIIV